MPQQSYNRGANVQLKTIKVLSMPASNVRLHVPNHVGYNFGLIGALITEANRDGKETWLQETARGQSFDQFELTRAALSKAMAEKGYELEWPGSLTDVSKVARDQFGLRKKYQAVEADAQLDLGLSYVGYTAAGSGKAQPYRPTVNIAVRLLDASGKRVLFVDSIRYHNVLDDTKAIILEPDPAYSYPTFDGLKAAGPTAIDGLRVAVESSAQAVADQL